MKNAREGNCYCLIQQAAKHHTTLHLPLTLTMGWERELKKGKTQGFR